MKKVLSLLLVSLMLFGLVACAPAAKQPAETKAETKVEETKAEETKAEETKAEETKAEETKAEETKAGESKAEEAAAPADFKGRSLNVLTTSEAYKALFDKFSEETGAKVEFLSMSSGEVIARVKAEGGTPMADFWFGGGLDAFLAAKADGLLESYTSDSVKALKPEFHDEEGFWLSKGITVGGLIINEAMLKEKGLPTPKSWKDLADPQYKDLVIMSNPAVSGTMYAIVKGLLDHYGEDEGWKLLEGINANIPFYGKRGKDPEEKTVAGEFAIGIVPLDKKTFDAAAEHGLTALYPEDAIPWVPEGVAIFKNAENVDVAKAFIDFMLRDENLQTLAELDGKDSAQIIKDGIKGYDLGLPQDKLVKEDLSSFGTQREEILKRFTEMAGDRIGE